MLTNRFSVYKRIEISHRTVWKPCKHEASKMHLSQVSSVNIVSTCTFDEDHGSPVYDCGIV